MADVFDFYVHDDRTITFEIAEPIMMEDTGVTDFQFHVPKSLNGLDMTSWAWWFVFVNAEGTTITKPLVLSDDPERPLEYSVGTYTVEYGMSHKAGTVSFALESINADSGGTILNEWHTYSYQTGVKDTLQGNQAQYSETQSDIISALIQQIQQKYNALTGGATPEVKNSISEMTDHKKIYVLSTDGNWYLWNGSAWVSGGVYASGVTIDPTLTQPGQAAEALAVREAIDAASEEAADALTTAVTNLQTQATADHTRLQTQISQLSSDAETAVHSEEIRSIIKLTRAEYDGITVKDPETLYIVQDD